MINANKQDPIEAELPATFNIVSTYDPKLSAAIDARQNSRTKPPDSLGQLEKMAHQVGLIFKTDRPEMRLPHLVVFAGDHGAAKSGISPYPQEVTIQMVANFMKGGASINVIARHNHLDLVIVDAGIATDLVLEKTDSDIEFIDAKIARGTKNYIVEPAMSMDECQQAILAGDNVVRTLAAKGCNTIGFGEMGIANTGTASLLTHFLCGSVLNDVVGRGSGHTEAGVIHKRRLLQQACERVAGRELSPLSLLAEFGGFEIAMMTGAYLSAAQERMLILVDGVIATSALLVAHAMYPEILDYCIFSHCSAEPAHRAQLEHFNARAVLDLDLCLGEGSGSALVYPIIGNALALINEMAGFDEAGVTSQKITV